MPQSWTKPNTSDSHILVGSLFNNHDTKNTTKLHSNQISHSTVAPIPKTTHETAANKKHYWWCHFQFSSSIHTKHTKECLFMLNQQPNHHTQMMMRKNSRNQSKPSMNFTSSTTHEQKTSVVSPDALNQPQNP